MHSRSRGAFRPSFAINFPPSQSEGAGDAGRPKEAASQISICAPWAGEVCSTSQTFCHHPEYIAYAGFGLMVVAIGTKLNNLAH